MRCVTSPLGAPHPHSCTTGTLTLLPCALWPAAACCRVPVKVITVYRDEAEVNAARPGENLRLRVQGVEEEDVSSGFVLSSRFNPVPVGGLGLVCTLIL